MQWSVCQTRHKDRNRCRSSFLSLNSLLCSSGELEQRPEKVTSSSASQRCQNSRLSSHCSPKWPLLLLFIPSFPRNPSNLTPAAHRITKILHRWKILSWWSQERNHRHSCNKKHEHIAHWATYRYFQLSDRSRVNDKCMHGGHGAGKPSPLPHDRLYLQIRSQSAALREAIRKRAVVPTGWPSAEVPNGDMAQRAACTHTWELRARRQREGRQLLDDCEAITAVTARRKPPSTEPGGAPHAPPWGGVDVSRRGTQSHAPKRKSEKEKNQHNTRSDSGRWLLFFLFDKENAAERQEGLPSLPRAPLRWSPPWPRLQETGPDAAAAIGPQQVHEGRGGGAAELPGNRQARPNGRGLRRLEPLFGALLWEGDPPLRRWKRSVPELALPSRQSPSVWIRSYDKNLALKTSITS